MINLIKLNFRKSRLSFAVLLLAVLASVPLSLALKANAMAAAEAINLAMVYWALVGIPLSALALSAIAGADAASGDTRSVEQPLPVSQGWLLSASAGVALLEVGALVLAVYAVMGFTLPFETLNFAQKHAYRLYVFSAAFLTIYGFAVSYAFRNAVAGAALAAAAVLTVVYPVLMMSVLQSITFELISLTGLKLAVAGLALAGAAGALKLLSGVYARHEKNAAVKITAAALLLASPVLASLAGLSLVNHRARQVTGPVPAYRFSPSGGMEGGEFMLVQKPFTGEVLVADTDGNNAVLDRGGDAGRIKFGYLLPSPTFTRAQVLRVSGGTWIIFSKYGNDHKLFSGSLKEGFVQRAEMNSRWDCELVGGEKPGIVVSHSGGYFYALLQEGKKELKWEKLPALKTPEELRAFVVRKEAGAAGLARFEGKTLVYKNKSWPVPGALGTKFPAEGLKLADGLNFIVPAKTGTYLCRPDGKAKMLWPHYFRLGQNFYVTTEGTAWGTTISHSRITETGLTGRRSYDFDEPIFYILTRKGTELSGVQIRSALKKAGATDGTTSLLRAEGGTLWFNIEDRYLARVNAANTNEFALWKLPASAWRGKHALFSTNVSASSRGIFMAAVDGIYFMDWKGKLKKLV